MISFFVSAISSGISERPHREQLSIFLCQPAQIQLHIMTGDDLVKIITFPASGSAGEDILHIQRIAGSNRKAQINKLE